MSVTPYNFNGIEVPNVFGVAAPVSNKDADGATPLRNGGFLGRQFIDARKITLSGVWVPGPDGDFDTMEADFETWRIQMLTAGYQRLFIRDNYYYNAQCSSLVDTHRDFGSIGYDATFKLPDPRAYRSIPAGGTADGTSSAILVASGSTTFTVGGAVSPPWALQVQVVSAGTGSPGGAGPGEMTFTKVSTGETFMFTGMQSGGTYVASSIGQFVTLDGTDATSLIAGDIFELDAGANTISVSFSYVYMLSDAIEAIWRESTL